MHYYYYITHEHFLCFVFHSELSREREKNIDNKVDKEVWHPIFSSYFHITRVDSKVGKLTTIASKELSPLLKTPPS